MAAIGTLNAPSFVKKPNLWLTIGILVAKCMIIKRGVYIWFRMIQTWCIWLENIDFSRKIQLRSVFYGKYLDFRIEYCIATISVIPLIHTFKLVPCNIQKDIEKNGNTYYRTISNFRPCLSLAPLLSRYPVYRCEPCIHNFDKIDYLIKNFIIYCDYSILNTSVSHGWNTTRRKKIRIYTQWNTVPNMVWWRIPRANYLQPLSKFYFYTT